MTNVLVGLVWFTVFANIIARLAMYAANIALQSMQKIHNDRVQFQLPTKQLQHDGAVITMLRVAAAGAEYVIMIAVILNVSILTLSMCGIDTIFQYVISAAYNAAVVIILIKLATIIHTITTLHKVHKR